VLAVSHVMVQSAIVRRASGIGPVYVVGMRGMSVGRILIISAPALIGSGEFRDNRQMRLCGMV
jgi:hypothetical protein